MCAGLIGLNSAIQGNSFRDSAKQVLPFTGGIGAIVANNMKSSKQIKDKRNESKITVR